MKALPLQRLLLPLFVLSVLPLPADEIKMKAGQTYTGRITYEAADIVKIELNVSGSIKETKVLGRADIASITKDAPDDVEFNNLRKLLPTPSLLPVENYRKMLETGPDAFLRSFPDSKHTAKVKEIRDTLAKELDQVERGYLKLDEDWITPQDKIDFPELVDSRIRLARMGGYARTPNINSFISALREYEFIEENYLGSPAFPKAAELAIGTISGLGRQLQTLSANVEYQNAEFERSLAVASPENRAQITAARAREDKIFAEQVAADKKNGIKWVQLNFRSKPSIDEYLKLAGAELTRLREFDLAALAAQAEELVAVDKLIASNQIGDARSKLTVAAAMSGQKTGASSSKSKTKSGGTGGSYLAALNAKISAKEAEEREKAKAKAAASDSEALTANLKGSADGKGDASNGAPDSEPGKAPEGTKDADEKGKDKPAEPVDEFAALGGGKKSSETSAESKAKEKGSKTKSENKPKAKSTESEEGEDGEEVTTRKSRPAPVVIEDEDGFPFWVIPGGITLVAVIAIVVMKVLGFGGKKSEE
jgi:hypothetical protein